MELSEIQIANFNGVTTRCYLEFYCYVLTRITLCHVHLIYSTYIRLLMHKCELKVISV